MDILQLITHLKYVQYACNFISTADDSITIKELKEDFKQTYKAEMPFLNNQYFGIARLITLVMIRENLTKRSKIEDPKYMNDLNIIRHAITHNQIKSDKKGFIFTCQKGNFTLNYEDVIRFCEEIERDFCNV